MRPRAFSGIKPTGRPTLGNLLGAMRRWAADQERVDGMFCVVDLHALTVEHRPAELRERTGEAARLLLAAGIDPQRSIVFVQSHVPLHTELAWLMESTAYVGEMQRMVQYKEKSAQQASVRLSLHTYPALMAADILLYGVEEVPVGDDQRQHVELARDLAERFNARYGETFVVPRAVTPAAAARVMDLSDPTTKMGKSNVDSPGNVLLLDPPAVVRRKVARAVTDSGGEVRYDPVGKPGVANLLEILGACVGRPPADLADGYASYRDLKRDVAEAVVAVLEPLQRRYAELTEEEDRLREVLAEGARRAAGLGAERLGNARRAVGLLD
jgi:tryptophanyl-tRNA synthetase